VGSRGDCANAGALSANSRSGTSRAFMISPRVGFITSRAARRGTKCYTAYEKCYTAVTRDAPPSMARSRRHGAGRVPPFLVVTECLRALAALFLHRSGRQQAASSPASRS
jgi:hypothetical protein